MLPVAAEAVGNDSVAEAEAAAATIIRGTRVSPGNPAGRARPSRMSYRSSEGQRLQFVGDGSPAIVRFARLIERKTPAALSKFMIGDCYARTRSIKLYQTPERTHATAKTARQGRTPHSAQG